MTSTIKPTLALLLILSFSTAPSCEGGIDRKARIREGNRIVTKIESFRRDKGRLPNTLSEIGIEEKEEGPFYYEKKSEGKYVLWFGTTLGESVTYDSDTRKWS
jgi:hypothetical protein